MTRESLTEEFDFEPNYVAVIIDNIPEHLSNDEAALLPICVRHMCYYPEKPSDEDLDGLWYELGTDEEFGITELVSEDKLTMYILPWDEFEKELLPLINTSELTEVKND